MLFIELKMAKLHLQSYVHTCSLILASLVLSILQETITTLDVVAFKERGREGGHLPLFGKELIQTMVEDEG